MDTADNARAAGLAASEAGRLAETYRLLLPLAEAGDAEAQAIVGSLQAYSLHRYESWEQVNAGTGPVIDEATMSADWEQGGRFLQSASDAGIGPASYNLAGMFVTGYGGGTWEERKAQAADLYARAHAQGFTAFASLMHRNGPGRPYLRIMEEHAIRQDGPLHGEVKSADEPRAAPDRRDE